MSCTDDKTPCPCGPEMRRFEAADLKQAILTNNGADETDEDGDYEDEGESWYMLESGVPVPDENYDPELAAEASRLYSVWSAARDWQVQSLEYAALTAFREAHGDKLSETKYVPWLFRWNGKELPVTVVEDNGGGEAVHMVYKVCDRLFRLDGSYYSYDGTTWDDDSFREVKPVVKQVTFYE